MVKEKIFDGMTFIHSSESIKKRTKELSELFDKTQYGDDEELFDDNGELKEDIFWELQIKVAEIKDKFIFVYSGTMENYYITYKDINDDGTINVHEEFCFPDYDYINKLKEVMIKCGASEEFIQNFFEVYFKINDINSGLDF